MLEGHDIIAFSFADWKAPWGTVQQTMTRLAPANRVLYVDVPRSIVRAIRRRHNDDATPPWTGPRLQEVRPNLHVYHLPAVFAPIGRMPTAAAKLALRANGRVVARMVGRAARYLGLRRPIVWNFSPLHGEAVAAVDRSLTIYDICDEWASYARDATVRAVTAWEDRRLTAAADVVFVVTAAMKQRRAELNDEIHVVYNGVDVAHFEKAADPATPVPEDLARLPRPVVGAIGVFEGIRFDADLIAFLAAHRPRWSFALVGPVRPEVDVSALTRYPNVHLLGRRAIAELPGYLRGMDVTIIPYRLNETTRDIFPLKLPEYLAAGKPVVSPPLPACLLFQDVVGIAEGREAFVRRIEEALAEASDEKARARRAVARANSWERRIAEKAAHIERVAQQGARLPRR